VSRLTKNCKKRRLKNCGHINNNMEKIGRLTRAVSREIGSKNGKSKELWTFMHRPCCRKIGR
jgi:hypothetical protein